MSFSFLMYVGFAVILRQYLKKTLFWSRQRKNLFRHRKTIFDSVNLLHFLMNSCFKTVTACLWGLWTVAPWTEGHPRHVVSKLKTRDWKLHIYISLFVYKWCVVVTYQPHAHISNSCKRYVLFTYRSIFFTSCKTLYHLIRANLVYWSGLKRNNYGTNGYWFTFPTVYWYH